MEPITTTIAVGIATDLVKDIAVETYKELKATHTYINEVNATSMQDAVNSCKKAINLIAPIGEDDSFYVAYGLAAIEKAIAQTPLPYISGTVTGIKNGFKKFST